LFTWAGVFGLSAVGGGVAWRYRQLMRRNPFARANLLKRFATCKKYHSLALLAFFLLALYGLGWGGLFKPARTAEEMQLVHDWPGLELLLLAPFFAGLALSWLCYYEVDRAAHDLFLGLDPDGFPGRWSYLGLQARHHLLLVMPPLVMLVLQQTLFLALPDLQENDGVLVFVSLGMLAIAMLVLPYILRLFLGLKPLGEGPLRTQLEAAARRFNFRQSGILLWDTHGTVANAMVTGMLPWGRFVVVTDRLIAELTPDEVEAVFGHEVGHIKHHHITYFLLFLIMSVTTLGGLWKWTTSMIEQPAVQAWLADNADYLRVMLSNNEQWASLPLLLGVAAYIFVVFGYLSRRCERQADIFGCRAVSTDAFISALEKVADLNGMSRDKPGWLASWRHGSIAQRIDFLTRMKDDPQVEPRFQRTVGMVKWGVAAGLLGMIVLLSRHSGWEMLRHF